MVTFFLFFETVRKKIRNTHFVVNPIVHTCVKTIFTFSYIRRLYLNKVNLADIFSIDQSIVSSQNENNVIVFDIIYYRIYDMHI